jgi:hypothetical protein
MGFGVGVIGLSVAIGSAQNRKERVRSGPTLTVQIAWNEIDGAFNTPASV